MLAGVLAVAMRSFGLFERGSNTLDLTVMQEQVGPATDDSGSPISVAGQPAGAYVHGAVQVNWHSCYSCYSCPFPYSHTRATARLPDLITSWPVPRRQS